MPVMLASRGRWWMLGSGLLLAGNGKAVNSSGGAGGGGVGSSDGSSGQPNGAADSGGLSGSSEEPACPACPAALDVQLCCAEFWGYLNTESGEGSKDRAANR